MKHFPKKLIAFRSLRGGTYGTLDVSARDPNQIELALGGDLVLLDRRHWAALRAAVDAALGTEMVVTETVVATDERGEPIVYEARIEEEVDPRPRPRRRGQQQA